MTVLRSRDYWEARYQKGGTSGAGSRGEESEHKAELLQSLIEDRHVRSLLDLGCGDGVVMKQISVEEYTGYDHSPTALDLAREQIPQGRFVSEVPADEEFDLVVSMDVMHHLIEEEVYQDYLNTMFSGIGREVFVYGTSHHEVGHFHVRHREWLRDVPEGWSVEELQTRFKRAWLFSRI